MLFRETMLQCFLVAKIYSLRYSISDCLGFQNEKGIKLMVGRGNCLR